MSELPQFIRVRHGQVDQEHELTVKMARFSPSIEFYHPTTRYTPDGYDTGIVDGNDKTDYSAALKRFRASVDSVDWEDKKKIMELDTAHLYFGLFDGGGEDNLVDPENKYPLSESAPIGQPVKGLPFRIQKIHFYGYQGDSTNCSQAFAGGPTVDGAVSAAKIKEYSCYALCSSPVLVNNAPDPDDPFGSTLTNKSEYQEQSNGVEKEWIERFESSSDAISKYPKRVIIGGAPLTKIKIVTGIEYDCGNNELSYKSCYAYVGYPESVYSATTVFETEKIEFLDPTKAECVPSAATAIKCEGVYPAGTSCLDDTLAKLDDTLAKLDCLCDALTGVTGADGSAVFPDCCTGGDGGGTTTEGPCALPPEIEALEDSSTYIIDTEGVLSCRDGASIKADWIDSCENEYPMPYTIGEEADLDTCECLAAGEPLLTDEMWYHIRNDLVDTEGTWMLGSYVKANYLELCPIYVTCGPVQDPSTLDPALVSDKWYKLTYTYCADGAESPTEYTVVWEGATIISSWNSSKFSYYHVLGPYDTFEEADEAVYEEPE